ncbi:MAG: prephenate dehydratase domain-containing protein [Vicinamibacterales bacterium]
MRIAYQGEPGAFSEAASRLVSDTADLLPCKAFEDVFAAVNSGAADYGVLPIENSIGGSIHRNFDLLLENQLPDRRRGRSAGGPPSAGAARHVARRHQTGVPASAGARAVRLFPADARRRGSDREAYDTAGSAKLVADQHWTDAAAIASARAGDVNGLVALRSGIQDNDTNTTRFLVVGKTPLSEAPADKTTIVFTLANEPGALFKALAAIALRGIDLTKLESRPNPGRKWEDSFYVDLAAARDDAACARALAHLGEFAPMLRVLGSYPSSKPAKRQPASSLA